jgi:hypothetical protein
VPRFSVGVAALALIAGLGACSSGHDTPTTTAASVVPADVAAFVSYSLDPPRGQRQALAAAMTPRGAPGRTFADARNQLLAGLGRPLGIDVATDVVPWATDEIGLAILAGGQAVLVANAGDRAKAATVLDARKLAHKLAGTRVLVAKDAATLDKMATTAGAALDASSRYQRAVAAAPADRLGIGLIDMRVCRASAKGKVDFSVRAESTGLVAEGTAGGSLADMAPGDPSATNSLPVDTLASITAFSSGAINDVADGALGCIPSLSPTPAASSVLAAGLPAGVPANFGVDIDRDVTPWAHGETLVAIGPPRSPASVADIGVISRPANAAAAASALPRIEDALALAGQFQWVPHDQGGVHFLTIPNPVAGVGGLQPSIGFVNGRVVIASSPEYFVSLAKPSDPKLGSGNAYQADVSKPDGDKLARAVVHLSELRDLFGGKLPLNVTSDDPILSKADNVVFTLTRDGTLTRFRLLVRFF